MAIDWTTLVGATMGIQVKKGDYDFTRDGGSVGAHAISGDVIPDGSIILGWLTYTTTALTFAGGGSQDILLGPNSLTGLQWGLEEQDLEIQQSSTPMLVNGDLQPFLLITTAAMLTGAFTLWVFYLPT